MITTSAFLWMLTLLSLILGGDEVTRTFKHEIVCCGGLIFKPDSSSKSGVSTILSLFQNFHLSERL